MGAGLGRFKPTIRAVGIIRTPDWPSGERE